MTPHQITLARNSWYKLKRMDTIVIGDIFYSKLFLAAPEVQPLFKSPRLEQANKLTTTLSVVVSQLEQLDRLTNAIEQLAIRHVKYGVKPRHYNLVGTALLWSLEHLLKGDWNESLKEAWSACYDRLAQSMIRTAYKVQTIK
jgi:hemoglobin-like flavoprotein